jgi:hypothetical protein
MERRRRHLECRRGPGGCCVVDDRTCQKKLMASWLKRPVPRKVVKKLSAWAREGLLLVLLVLVSDADIESSLPYSSDSLYLCVIPGNRVGSSGKVSLSEC